jgi:hypothetical protein
MPGKKPTVVFAQRLKKGFDNERIMNTPRPAQPLENIAVTAPLEEKQ